MIVSQYVVYHNTHRNQQYEYHDIYNPMHWHQMQIMFQRNARRNEVENNMTQPDDAINRALMEFEHGSNGSTESQELLQLSSDGDKSSS